MRIFLFFVGFFSLMLNLVFANDSCCVENFSIDEYKKQCPCEKCDKCQIEDDEYCVYNQCYFDKHYVRMKKFLCLSKKQETNIDKIYKDFKIDMEKQHLKYKDEKNKLLDMLECEKDYYKEQIKVVKEIKNETKEKLKEFKEDIKEQLCKNQYSDYRKFLRNEKRKMRKIAKYSKVYKFPCTDCCK